MPGFGKKKPSQAPAPPKKEKEPPKEEKKKEVPEHVEGMTPEMRTSPSLEVDPAGYFWRQYPEKSPYKGLEAMKDHEPKPFRVPVHFNPALRMRNVWLLAKRRMNDLHSGKYDLLEKEFDPKILQADKYADPDMPLIPTKPGELPIPAHIDPIIKRANEEFYKQFERQKYEAAPLNTFTHEPYTKAEQSISNFYERTRQGKEEEEIKRLRGENDDDFWERRSILELREPEFVDPSGYESMRPEVDYAKFMSNFYTNEKGTRPKLLPYMQHPGQPTFLDEHEKHILPTKLEDVTDDDVVIEHKDKADNNLLFANNVQKMFNKVQKYHIQKKREEVAMGIKPILPPIENSKYKNVDRLCGAVIIERYPILHPLEQPFELEHEEWEQSIRLKTCRPIVGVYRLLLHWEKHTNAMKSKLPNDGIEGGGPVSEGGDDESGKKGHAQAQKRTPSKKDRRGGDAPSKFSLDARPPDYGLPKLGELVYTEDEARDLKKSEAARMKPYEEYLEYWRNWQAADRETDDDRKLNRKSTNRALDKKLYLIVKKRGRTSYVWQFPTKEIRQKETLRSACERIVEEHFDGFNLHKFFYSNGPCGYLKYYYSTEELQDKYKAEANKVFFMRMRYMSGEIKIPLGDDFADHLWVTRDELPQFFEPDYWKRVDDFIWPDAK